MVAGGLLAISEQPDKAATRLVASGLLAISEQPIRGTLAVGEQPCLLSAGSSLVIARSGSLTASSRLVRAFKLVGELELGLK